MKCAKCGAVLKQYNDKKTGWYFYPNLKTGFPRKRSNYTFKYRMVCNARYGNRNHRMVCISMDTDKYNAALCIDCYIQELKKALYAAENLAEKIHNGVNPEEETDQKPEEPKESEITDEEVRQDYPEQDKQEAEKQETLSAQKIKEKYPKFYEDVKRANDGRDVADNTLEFLFKHRENKYR